MAGFLIAFIAILTLVNQLYLRGDELVLCKTWEYYLLEIRRAFTPQNLGPVGRSGPGAIGVLLTHLAASSIAGLFSMTIGAIVHRFRKSRKTS